ncbi:MAG: ATP-binding protein [Brevinematales bacterium]|nr:ATP-binding protein [Brevinematales bacterium]
MLITDDIKNLFKQESEKHIERSDNLIIELEKNPENIEIIKEIKREIHTLKGSSRMIGLNKISRVAHQIENIFESLELKELKISSNLITFILKWLDWIKNAIYKIPEEPNLDENFEENFLSSLEKIKKNESAKIQTDEKPKQDKPIEEQSKKSDYLAIKFEKIKSLLTFSNIFTNYIGRFKYFEDKFEQINYEELSKNDIVAIIQKIKDELSYELHFYELYTKQFQDLVSSLILVPLSTIFNNYPRLIRDVAVSTQKDVNFTIEGRELEIDKQLIEPINNVLIHLLRNAVDHGVETPMERVKAGKPSKGNIILKAYSHMDRMIIEVKDDGKGIDIEKVKEKAIRNNLLTTEEALNLTENEILQFIFKPGFSTKDNVTDFSGRGVGLDVVADTMRKFNSEVIVKNEKNKGTTFILSFPLNSSIMSITLFEVNNEIFSIPSLNIEKVVLFSETKTSIIEEEKMLEYDKKWIPLINLKKMFYDLDDEIDFENIIIITSQNKNYGLLTGKIIGESRMVIKTISSLQNKLKIASGVISLSNRDVIVLNVFELIDKYRTINSYRS